MNKKERKAYNKAYYQKPEVKAHMKAYYQRPEVKAHMKAYKKAYYQRPEVKARMKAYKKAYNKAYNQRPETKAHMKAHMKAYNKAYRQRPEVKAHMKITKEDCKNIMQRMSDVTADGMIDGQGKVVKKVRKGNKSIIFYECKDPYPTRYRKQTINLDTGEDIWKDVRSMKA